MVPMMTQDQFKRRAHAMGYTQHLLHHDIYCCGNKMITAHDLQALMEEMDAAATSTLEPV
jgi:hypothetical protein